MCLRINWLIITHLMKKSREPDPDDHGKLFCLDLLPVMQENSWNWALQFQRKNVSIKTWAA